MNRRHPELNVSIIGRANRMKKVVGDAFVTENVHLDGEVLKYKQLEGQFAQPNAQVATEMLKFVRSCWILLLHRMPIFWNYTVAMVISQWR